MERFPLNTIVNFRSCGDCQACCTVVGVQELSKPHWTRCRHQCGVGCAITKSAPDRAGAIAVSGQPGFSMETKHAGRTS